MPKTPEFKATALFLAVQKHALTGNSQAGQIVEAQKRASAAVVDYRPVLAAAAEHLVSVGNGMIAAKYVDPCGLPITKLGGAAVEQPYGVALRPRCDGTVVLVVSGRQPMHLSPHEIDTRVADAVKWLLTNVPADRVHVGLPGIDFSNGDPDDAA